MSYSPELAKKYSDLRETFNETDSELFECIEKVGIKNKDVLDLGCGDGRHALFVKNMGANKVIGVDVEENMIALAKERAIAEKVEIEFLVADGKKLLFGDETFDVVFSNFVIHYFINSKDVFSEISRVLRKGGFFVGTLNITDVKEGFEHLYNTNMPMRLGVGENSVVVQNIIKNKGEILNSIQKAGFEIQLEKELEHPNAIVDESFNDKDNIKKHVMIFVLKKI